MTNIDDPTELPTEYYKSVLEDLARDEKFEKYKIDVTLASSKGENYLGLLYRIKITGTKDGVPDSELSAIMKIPIQLPIFREKFPIRAIYIREAFVYSCLFPKLKQIQDSFNIPEDEKVQFVNSFKTSDEDNNEYLLLEDLRASGFKMAQRRQPSPYANLRLVLQTLARFHALSFVFKDIEPELFEEYSSKLGGIDDFPEGFRDFINIAVDRGLQVITDEKTREKSKVFFTDAYDKMRNFLSRELVDNYVTICHGDCWNNNFLFKYKDNEAVELRSVDWQICRTTSPITDLAYFIMTNTDQELRRAHYNDLMDFYHETMATALRHMDRDINKCYPKAKFQEHLKKIMPFGFLMAITLLPIVVGEVEDIPDMETAIAKEKPDADDFKFESKDSSSRFESRFNGVVQFFIEQNYI